VFFSGAPVAPTAVDMYEPMGGVQQQAGAGAAE
jgi:hypothetical protein